MKQANIGFLAVTALGTVLATTLGCSTSATVSRVNGPAMDVHFVGSDASSIYVKTESGSQVVPRTEVTDIDHPGDTVAVIGGILAGYGAVNIAIGAKQCKTEGAAFCTGVFLPAGIGLPMLIWGLVVHSNSTSSLEQPVGSVGQAGAYRLEPSLFVTESGHTAAGIQGRF